jgi:hypothetical protein
MIGPMPKTGWANNITDQIFRYEIPDEKSVFRIRWHPLASQSSGP